MKHEATDAFVQLWKLISDGQAAEALGKVGQSEPEPGQSGNPAGRPNGSKNRFSEDFWRDLADVWAAEGKRQLGRLHSSQ